MKSVLETIQDKGLRRAWPLLLSGALGLVVLSLVVPTATATIFAVLSASAFAYWTIVNQRQIARRRNTLDFIFKFESDDFYQSTISAYREFRAGLLPVETVIDPKTESDKETTARLNAFFNYCEIVAIGIRNGALDEALFREWWGSTFVRIWNAAVPLTTKLREIRTPRTFVNFEIIARRFAGHADVNVAMVEVTAPEAVSAPPE